MVELLTRGVYNKLLGIVFFYLLIGVGDATRKGVVGPTCGPWSHSGRRLSAIVDEPKVLLNYYYGPLLSGSEPIPVYIIWYGNFSNSQRAIVQDFLASFNTSPSAYDRAIYPTVQGWWNMTAGYVDANGVGIASLVSLAGELDNPYSMGRSLSEYDIQKLVLDSIRRQIFPAKYSATYFVLTSADVEVDSFCTSACGSHYSTYPSRITRGQQLPYAWVGNSGTQCPGMCTWPYAQSAYGPPLVLLSPNGDVGMDGLIVNLASLLAAMATNPYNTGYYEGDALAPLESATACAGIYGPNASPGQPGLLFVDPYTNASFNAVGITGREFLLPSIWIPSNQTCNPPPYY
ncbi:hypothetical protein R1flu_023204 [Riccia fluitans]|uniref:Uncharacterized protein n=1 Tax=Riccia fluitans TaxID=41844 RepID=A0ABD1XRD0_9MARC